MINFLKRLGAWLTAILIVVILAVTLQTQNVIARLGKLGANIGFGDRLSMTAYDISHLGSLYAIFIAIALAIAFLASGLLYRFTKFGRPVIYAVAGAVAILIMLLAMKQTFFGVHIIAGARDGFGIALQMLAGSIGGWVFAHLTRNLSGKKISTHENEEIIED